MEARRIAVNNEKLQAMPAARSAFPARFYCPIWEDSREQAV
jgi:hypothetical protein